MQNCESMLHVAPLPQWSWASLGGLLEPHATRKTRRLARKVLHPLSRIADAWPLAAAHEIAYSSCEAVERERPHREHARDHLDRRAGPEPVGLGIEPRRATEVMREPAQPLDAARARLCRVI